MTPTSYEVEQRASRRELDRRDLRRRRRHGGGHQLRSQRPAVRNVDYEFRVRAVPDSGDDTLTTSAWTTVGTTGRTPTPVEGGTGGLNVRWESANNSITWIWDRIPGAKYDYAATE